MDTVTQPTFVPMTLLSDLATVLKAKGMADKDIAELLQKVIVETQAQTIEELVLRLTPEKQQLLDELTEKNASGEEIAEKLDITEEEINQIELARFAAVVQELVPLINY